MIPRTFLAASAAALLAAGAAGAQTVTTTETPEDGDATIIATDDMARASEGMATESGMFVDTALEYGETYLATTLIGQRVHATDQEIDVMTPYPAGTVEEWDDIGEIGDMIIGVDGTLQAVVLDVGGFLGIGEREVAIQWSALRGVREDDDEDEYFLGVTMSEGMLENAPALERVPAPME
jgi:hypothetical protein